MSHSYKTKKASVSIADTQVSKWGYKFINNCLTGGTYKQVQLGSGNVKPFPNHRDKTAL